MAGERDLDLAVLRLAWRLDALDQWRAETVDPSLVRLDVKLRDIVKADEIADAVAEKMKAQGRIQLTRVQTVIAACAAVAAILSPILTRVL